MHSYIHIVYVFIIDICAFKRYHILRLNDYINKNITNNIISEKKHEKTIYIKDG